MSLGALFSLEDRVALVTGGTRGVGAMLARGLLMAGARVIISGRDTRAGEAAAISLGEYGPCEFVCGDLSSEQGISQLAEVVAGRAPGLNVLVNNAGMTIRGDVGQVSGDDFEQVMSLNLKAPFLLAQGLHPLLRDNASAARPSHIVNTGSIAGLSTSSGSFPYGASKAGLHHLTRMLACKLAADHIRVNAIAPGLFASDMTSDFLDDEKLLAATVGRTPVGRIGQPDDLASLIVAVVCNGYLTGTVIPIDGGMSI